MLDKLKIHLARQVDLKLWRPLEARLTRHWYSPDQPVSTPLALLGAAFRRVAGVRRNMYREGALKTDFLPVPVVVVGNLTVGGAGKTPLVIALVEILRRAGYTPGVISRGYGGSSRDWPVRVDPGSDPAQVGDEPVLIAQRARCPVAVGPDRIDAACELLDQDCDVIVADDGLQHYALGRAVEIAVIDGERGLGNGLCLPAGPLREPPERLRSVDFIVRNSGEPETGEFAMHLSGSWARNLATGALRPLSAFTTHRARAVAGIGNPERFFSQLRDHGLVIETRALPDHHAFLPGDLVWGIDSPLFMTEKDAVKCAHLANPNLWAVPVDAELASAFAPAFLHMLRARTDGCESS